MAYSVSPTPSYSGYDYSKGPRTSVYSNENYLKLYLNTPQMDTDDEWGRTEYIAVRSLVDHVTDIWENLFGSTPTSGAGISGNVTDILKIVDTDNDRITLPNKTSATTLLETGGLYFNAAESIGVYTCGANFDAGTGALSIDVVSSSTTKRIEAFSNSRFSLNFVQGPSNNDIILRVPTGAGDADTHNMILGESGITFPTSLAFTAGDASLTSMTAGTASVTNTLNIGSYMQALSSGSIYYCNSAMANVNDWMLTSLRLVIGPNSPTANRVEVNNENGLMIYCGNSGGLSGRYSDKLMALYTVSGTQMATVENSGSAAVFKLDAGAQLQIYGTAAQSKYMRLLADAVRVVDPDGSTNTYTETTQNSLSIVSSDETQFKVTGSTLSFYCSNWPVTVFTHITSTTPNSNVLKLNTDEFRIVDVDSASNYMSLKNPRTGVDGGVFIYCGNYGAEYTGTYVHFKDNNVQKLTIDMNEVRYHQGVRSIYGLTTLKIQPDSMGNGLDTPFMVDMSDGSLTMYCSGAVSTQIHKNYWAFFDASSIQRLTLIPGGIKIHEGATIRFGATSGTDEYMYIEKSTPSNILHVDVSDLPTSSGDVSTGELYVDSGTVKVK